MPHDHNVDYPDDLSSIHPECAAIAAYAKAHGCHYAFNFHAPWHKGAHNDIAFIVQNTQSAQKLKATEFFGTLLEASLTPAALRYAQSGDFPPNTRWNQDGPLFECFMDRLPENKVAFTFETTYFGTAQNMVSEENLLELGRCFARAIQAFADRTDSKQDQNVL